LNLEVPPPQSDAALWSGRRLVDRAVIRTFKPGGGEAQVQVEAWPGHPVTLLADAAGRTYRLRLERTGVQVEAIQAR